MLLVVENHIRGAICYTIQQYEKANNKFMKYNDKNNESSYFKHWEARQYHKVFV